MEAGLVAASSGILALQIFGFYKDIKSMFNHSEKSAAVFKVIYKKD